MDTSVGNLRKMLESLPDEADIVTEDWDGAAIRRMNHSTNEPLALEELLMVHDGRLYIVNKQATENECHRWQRG